MSASGRTWTRAGALIRAGFVDSARAESNLDALALGKALSEEVLVEMLSATADPDLALASLADLVAATSERADDRRAILDLLAGEDAMRVLLVLGVSLELGRHLARHPPQALEVVAPVPTSARAMADELLRAVGAHLSTGGEPTARAGGDAELNALRVAYRGVLLRIVAADLAGQGDLIGTAGALADLAEATLEAALAIARAGVGPDSDDVRLAVVGMGKAGGHELNYVSDVDVVFVVEPNEGVSEERATSVGTAVATALMRACSSMTVEGAIWPVDAGLRPEGKSGALVRTLASHLAYYEKWAKTWEFQALLKARVMAGDRALGQAYVDAVSPLVWRAASSPDFVVDVQAMRRRVESTLPASQAEREIKLGPGGLRDIEFAVQLLQLVHGRSDVRLRSGNTLQALEALSTNGYVARSDAAELDRAYRFLRQLEHRVQLYRLRRTHALPDDEVELRRLGRSFGLFVDPGAALVKQWKEERREVRRLHEKLFYRPLLTAVAQLAPDEARLTTEAARERLEALGYRDPAGALRHIEALTTGVNRRTAIQRTLLPVMLGWFADSADPDAGLFGFRRLSESLGATPWFLRLLRDESAAAERLAHLLGSSRYVTELLLRAPEATALVADDEELAPRSREELIPEMLAGVIRHEDPTLAIESVRAVRRRELVRIAMGDVLGMHDVTVVGEALTDAADATVVAALALAEKAIEAERRRPLPMRMLVVAMGRFGGRELAYSSDADVMFVYEPLPGAHERDATDAAHDVANEMRRWLALPGPDLPLQLDADLRPEGRNGPLVRSLESYRAYYARWSLVWEAQALVRARAVAGDVDLGARFEEMIAPLRWPVDGLGRDEVTEIRRIKARVEAERLPRGADPQLHMKLGRGGLADVEWTAQLLQMQHAWEIAELRTTETLPALEAASDAGLMGKEDADTLAEAWRCATRVRNGVMLTRGRPGDMVPIDPDERARVARLVGYPPGDSGRLVEDYRRVTRRARAVAEKVFYG